MSYSLNVAYLARWGGAAVVEWGHRRQEQGCRCRKPAAAPGEGQCCGPWGDPVVRSEGDRSGVPAAAYYSAREDGMGGAGTLEEESLRRPYVPPSRDWCVPH